MAGKLTKTKINEKAEVVKEEETAAAATLHPGSKAVDDPQSKVGVIAAAIGAMHAMSSDELTKWWSQTLEASKNQSRGVPDGSAEKNQASIRTGVKEAIKQDVDTMLAGTEGLTEEFKTQAATLFEAAVEARVQAELVAINEANEAKIEEQVTEIASELVKQFDTYTDYVVTEWFKENQVAVDSALRTEMTEDFIKGLQKLFAEHYIEVPADKVDVINTMAEKIDELEARLNDVLDENVNLQSFVIKAQKKAVIDELSEGLTLVESTKLKELAENVEVEDIDTFKTKVKVIKESQFVKAAKKTVINESLEEADEENAEKKDPVLAPNMAQYVKAISRSVTTR